MPSKFGGIEVKKSKFGGVPVKGQAEKDPGFLYGLYESTLKPAVDVVSGLASMGPYESRSEAVTKGTVGFLQGVQQAMLGQPWEYAKKTGQAMLKGDVLGAVRYAPGMVPLFGPAVENIADIAEQKQYGRAAGNVAGMVGTAALSEFSPKVKMGPVVKNVLNPVERAALKSQEPFVDQSVGQQTGQLGLQRIEQALPNLPGSSSRAMKFYNTQTDQLQARARSLSARVSPTKTDPVGSGMAMEDKLTSQISLLKGHADAVYNDVRKASEAAKKTVQTGVKTTTSPILSPSGQPIVTHTPVMKTFETPVDLPPIRNALRSVHEDLLRAMPEARRAYSPGWKVLDELMRSDEPFMNAMDWDKSLGAIKALTRNGDSPFLTTQSQRIAKQLIARGEKQLESSMQSAGTGVYGKLQSGRALVKAYHETAETLADLRYIKYGQAEPAILFRHLTEGGDAVYKTLENLNKVAPKEVKLVGRTLLEGIWDKTSASGGFSRGAGALADWKKLGPRTKQLIYGPQMTQELDQFFLAAEKLTHPQNPSGSAHMAIAVGGGMGAAGMILGAALTGKFMEAAGIAASAFAVPNIMARLLFTPGGARLMTQAITFRVGTPAFYKTVTTLNAMVRDIQESEKSTPNQ